MLPPQLRQGTAVSKHRFVPNNALGASSTVLIRSSTAHSQRRTMWHHGWNWSSRMDPIYQRYCRARTLKTRAKLIKNIRRRGKFDWDFSAKPFFTAGNVRNASHWRGGLGQQWIPDQKAKDQAALKQQLEDEMTNQDEARRAEGGGYELSQREKEWKEQMEALRKRIDQDPYEAVFGRRVEPFWGSLMPTWMREEMGFNTQQEKKSDKDKSKPAANDNTRAAPKSNETTRPTEPKDDIDALHDRLKIQLPKLTTVNPTSLRAESRPKSYAYASSTSWDSVSKKTRKVEWDSTSRQTKTFQYDPISNRMVEIEAPRSPASDKAAIDSDSSAIRQSTKQKATTSTPKSTEEAKNDMSLKQSDGLRKAIPIPPPLSQPSHGITLGFTQTSIGPLRSTAVASSSVKPAALAKLPAKDLDLLTADQVRASMGKVAEPKTGSKATTTEEKVQLEKDFDAQSQAQDLEIDAILKERDAARQAPRSSSSWDQAETIEMLKRELENLDIKREKLLRDEKNLFHIERQKRELLKLDTRIRDITGRVDAIDRSLPDDVSSPSKQTPRSTSASKQGGVLQPTLDRLEHKSEQLDVKMALANLGGFASMAAAEPAQPSSARLQPSVERMQSKSVPEIAADLDDAAAHESTEPVGSTASLPKNWTSQADLLQADRVKRSAAKVPFPKTRWIDDMNARRAAYETRKAETKAAEEAKNADRNAKLEKANALLQAEIADQKQNMQAFEGRYTQKVKALRGELERTFKQSSVHDEKHLEWIRDLEAEVKVLKDREAKYADKVKSLRGELERAYKQSAVHGEKHVERIRSLEAELERVSATSGRALGDEASGAAIEMEAASYPAEGDLCVNAPKFAGSEKWYKKPSWAVQPTEQELEAARKEETKAKREAEQAEQIAHDRALVRDVREIYENEYGVIDENHRQPKFKSMDLIDSINSTSEPVDDNVAAQPPRKTRGQKKADKKARKAMEEHRQQVVEVESDVDLGEELAKYEQQNPQANKYTPIVEAEKETMPGKQDEMENVAAQYFDAEESGAAEQIGETASSSAAELQWAEPPLYKVLAYDSGNDMMSTATTTTSILPSSSTERPLAIPEALSQLYQPARFVPYFAELQSDGFQAIAATRDVIVFRKIGGLAVKADEEKAGAESTSEESAVFKPLSDMPGTMDTRRSKARSVSRSTNVNPIDGTSHKHQEPTTGNFASPTGFVNHDPIFPAEQAKTSAQEENDVEARSDTYSTVAKESFNSNSRQTWASLPGSGEARVTRTEPVFSGDRRTKKQRRRDERAAKALQQVNGNKGGEKAQKTSERSDDRQTEATDRILLFLFVLVTAPAMWFLWPASRDKAAVPPEETNSSSEEHQRKWKEQVAQERRAMEERWTKEIEYWKTQKAAEARALDWLSKNSGK